MAYSDRKYNNINKKGSRRPANDEDAGYGRRPSGRGYDEGYWEDEEDYEEYARSMDREYGIEDSRRRQVRGRNAGGYDDSRSGRGERPDGYAEAGNMDDAPAPKRRRGEAAASRKGSSGRKKKPRKKRGFFGILLRLIAILLLIAVIMAGILAYRVKDVLQMQRVNSVNLEEVLQNNINNRVRNDMTMEGYMNIALFGVDSRSGDLLDGDNRSDTIMIASINKKTGEISLVSVYRDTILDVGDGYYTKANTAYALGGPEQAIIMLNRNLDLNILDFVTVGFEGLAHTIDALGGIELEIDEEEREYLNQYVHDMHIELGTDETPVEESGLVNLTGIQATAYSRIRYTAGDDFRRAERQRIVLEKTLEKAKTASPTTLVDVANNVVGDMATSLSSKEIVNLILMASKLDLKDTGGLPQEEYREFADIEAGSAVMPSTLEKNVEWLHMFLFGVESYTASEEVKERSSWIENNVQPAYYY